MYQKCRKLTNWSFNINIIPKNEPYRLLPTTYVTVCANKRVQKSALLDTGSQRSYMNNKVVLELYESLDHLHTSKY